MLVMMVSCMYACLVAIICLITQYTSTKTGKKARQFDINEMMAIAKRNAAETAEEKSKSKGEEIKKCILT